MSDPVSLHAKIHGLVQGVFFRAFVEKKAAELGLTGFVRNLPSGEDIEVQAEGKKKDLGKLLDFLKIGPPAARVEHVEVTWSAPSGKYTRFSIKY